MPQINILLCVLAVEVDVVRCLTQMRRAGHAGVSICYVETTRIACIPVCKLLRNVRIRLLWLLHLSLYSSCAAIRLWSVLSSVLSAIGWSKR